MLRHFLLLQLVLLSFLSQAQEDSYGWSMVAGGMRTTESSFDTITLQDNSKRLFSIGDTHIYAGGGFYSRFLYSELAPFFGEIGGYLCADYSPYALTNYNDNNSINKTARFRMHLEVPVMAGLKFGPLRLQGGGVVQLPIGPFFGNATEVFENTISTAGLLGTAGIGIDMKKWSVDLRANANISRREDLVVVDKGLRSVGYSSQGFTLIISRSLTFDKFRRTSRDAKPRPQRY